MSYEVKQNRILSMTIHIYSYFLLFCILLPISAYGNLTSEGQMNPDYLYQRAETLYWFALEDGGDLLLLEESSKTLDLAEVAIQNGDLGSSDSLQISNSIYALRTELNEQIIIAHDTLNGLMPLFRYFTNRDTISEWFDDPWAIGAARGASSLSELAITGHWGFIPQLDVCFSSEVSQLGDCDSFQNEIVFSEALENEMSFIFNQSPRYFIHNRAELLSALGRTDYNSYQMNGMDVSLAQQLCQKWGIEKVVEVRIQEIFVEHPYWFYIVSGSLYSSKSTQVDGTVFTYSMIRDFQHKILWVLPVILYPLLLVLILCYFTNWNWRTAIPAFGVSLFVYIVFIIAIAPRLPSGAEMFISHWWGIAATALLLLLIAPLLLFFTSTRFGQLGRWLFVTDDSSRGTVFGFVSAIVGLIGFAVLSRYSWPYALFYSTLLLLALPYSTFRLFDILRADKKHGLISDWSAGIINLGIVFYILFAMPQKELTQGVVAFITLLIAVNFLSLILLKIGKLKFLLPSIVIPFAINSFFISMTGSWTYLIVFSIPFSIYVLESVFKKKIKQFKKLKQDSNFGSENLTWSEIFEEPNTKWPFWNDVSVFKDIQEHLSSAIEAVREDLPSVLLVTGESGVGKTRMIEELLHGERIKLIRGSCQKGDPHSFLEGMLSEYTQTMLDGSAVFSEVGSKLVSLLPGVGSFFSLIDEMSISTALSPNEISAILLDSIRSKTNRNSDIVVWFDNVEHLTLDGFTIIRSLMENATARQVGFCLILSGRGFKGSIQDFTCSGISRTCNINWTYDEIKSFLFNVIHKDSTSLFLEKVEGSSNFATVALYINWISHLWDIGKVQEVESKLVTKGEILESDIPIDILASAGIALSDLSGDTQQVLHAAACDGIKFNIHCLVQSLDMTLYDVLNCLNEAESKGLVEDLPADGEFGFTNSLICEYLLRTMRSSSQKGYRQIYYVLQRGLAEAYSTLRENQNIVKAAYHARNGGTSYLTRALILCIKACHRCFALGQWENTKDNAIFVLRNSGSHSEDKIVAGTFLLKANWSMNTKPDNTLISTLIDLCYQEKTSDNFNLEGEKTALLMCEVIRALWPSSWNPKPDFEMPNFFQNLPVEQFSSATRIRIKHFQACSLDKYANESRVDSYHRALTFLDEALSISIDSVQANQERAEALNTKATILIKQKSKNTSLIINSIEGSIKIKNENEDFIGLAISYGTLGRFHFYKEDATTDDFSKALNAFKEDLSISEQIGDTYGQVVMPSNIASCLLKLNRNEEALEYFKLCYKRANSLKQYTNVLFSQMGVIRALLPLNNASIESEYQKLLDLNREISSNALDYGKFIWAELLKEVKIHRPELLDMIKTFKFIS